MWSRYDLTSVFVGWCKNFRNCFVVSNWLWLECEMQPIGGFILKEDHSDQDIRVMGGLDSGFMAYTITCEDK